MKFLADESCDYAVVRALRKAGYDVDAICENISGISDFEVLDIANFEKAIVLTEDRDFGELIFSGIHSYDGSVIYIRWNANVRHLLPNVVVDFVEHHFNELQEIFVVLKPGKTRFRRFPL